MVNTTQGVGGTPGETTSPPDIARMLENSKELDRLRKVQEEVLFEINTMHANMRSSPVVLQMYGDNFLTRLRMLYTHAKKLSESEENISSELLGQLDSFMLWHQRKIEHNEPKRKQTKADSDISTQSPSVQKHLDTLSSLTGEQVAARVTDASEKDEWFIVKVLHVGRESREVEVLDEEPGDEEGGSQRTYKLPISHIIPFPRQNDVLGVQDFRPGEKVLALYPDTTTLYKATIVEPRKVKSSPIFVVIYLTQPLLNFNKLFGLVSHVSELGGGCPKLSSFLHHACYMLSTIFMNFQRKTDDYVLEFDDDEDEDGSLPQRVVPFYRVVGLPNE